MAVSKTEMSLGVSVLKLSGYLLTHERSKEEPDPFEKREALIKIDKKKITSN